MNEQHSGDDRRQHPRIERHDLCVRFNGEVHRVSNLSMGGFLVPGYRGRLTAGSLLTVDGLGADGEITVNTEIPARVIRKEEDVVAIRCLNFDAGARRFIATMMDPSEA
ncbi:MAG: PilZ domain-containing protein [Alphaproteobacteria bacterium]|nr:PilZ domain-containing protein [Alphaproteobacteria bacterium]